MSQTVLSCLKKGIRLLESAGVPEAQISAEELLSHVLRKPRVFLYLNPEAQIDCNFEKEFESLLGKRAGRYPLQYLLQSVPFRNVTLEVGEGCLIPRPETEILVDFVFGRLNRTDDCIKVLDIGTGSGNIAISIAKERPHWMVTATDISREALYYAAKNADRNGVAYQVRFLQADLCQGLEADQFDVVVSNPPYLTYGELDRMQPELDFEPRLAFDGGGDGLDFFRRITQATKQVLNQNGFIFFEVGMGQASSVRQILQENGFRSVEISRDNNGIERIVSGVLGNAVIPA